MKHGISDKVPMGSELPNLPVMHQLVLQLSDAT